LTTTKRKTIPIIILLVFSLLFIPIAPSNAEDVSLDKPKAQVIQIEENGNQILEVSQNDKKVYCVFSHGIIMDKPNEVEDNGVRYYFSLTENIDEAKEIVKYDPSANENQDDSSELSSSFWHGSYIESYSNWLHVHLAPVDVSYITSLGWVAADTLAAILIATGVVSITVGVALGGIATVAIISYSWYVQNNDGSVDIETQIPSLNPSRWVNPGQYLGWATSGTNWGHDYYWPSNAPAYGYP